MPYFSDHETYLGFRGKQEKKFGSKKCGKIVNNINNIIFHPM